MRCLLRTFRRGAQQQRRRFLAGQPESTSERVLVRDWIADSLYNPSYGYFSNADSPVGQLAQAISFSNLSGHQSYQQHLRFWYDKLQVEVLMTCVSPWNAAYPPNLLTSAGVMADTR